MHQTLVTMALLALSTAAWGQEVPNLITNPGFEEGADGTPADWTAGGVSGDPELTWERGDDGMCVRITAHAPEDFGRWNQPGMDAVEGVRVYRLSARIRTDLEGTTARVAPVYSRDGEWHGANYAAIVVRGDTDWQRHTTLIQPREGTTQIQITLRVNFEKAGTGSAWFDDVRLEPLPDMDGVPPISYEPANELPPLPAAAREAGLVLFPRQPENIAMAGYVPSADEIGRPITAWGANNQRVIASFCVHALDDLHDVRASVTDLTGGDGATIPADRITLQRARVLTRLIHSSLPDAIDVPTYLEPVEAMNMPSGTTTWYWLAIDGVPPGEFAGEVRVQAADRPAASIPLRIEGLPIELREPEAALGFYYLMRDAIADPNAMRADFAQMRARGMTGIGIVAALHIEAHDGAPVVVWDEENQLGVGMDAWTEAGFWRPIVWLMSGVHKFCINELGPLESDAFAAAYASIIEQVEARRREQGWPEIIYQPVDEPVGHEDRMAVTLRCLGLLNDAGVRTEEDGNLRPGHADFEAMYPLVSLINCNFRRHVEQQKAGTWESEMVRRCREDGKLLWTYNIDLCGYHPEVMRFGMGFGREACHSGGMIEWVWYSPREDPYVLDERRRQNMTYWYPPREGHAGGPSTGLEGAAEGATDAAYVATFNAAVAKARESDNADRRALAEDAVAEYEAQLAKIRFTDLRTEMAIQGEWTVPKHPNAEGFSCVSGEYRMPNGWELSDYDRTRRLLADWIVKLGG